MTVQYLKDYARKNHKGHREHETLVVIDECGIKFNPRTFAQADRLEWIEFFSHTAIMVMILYLFRNLTEWSIDRYGHFLNTITNIGTLEILSCSERFWRCFVAVLFSPM